MNDDQIIQLYFDRSEQAIKETDAKYGGYCYSIAYNILNNPEDAEESVSDTYLSAWNAMPPRRPPALAAFLGKITRNLSIDRWRKYRAFKRGEGQIELALEELRECVSGTESAEEAAIRKEILASLNRFLGTLKETERSVFLCRYWYLDSTEEIAEKSGFTVSKSRLLTAVKECFSGAVFRPAQAVAVTAMDDVQLPGIFQPGYPQRENRHGIAIKAVCAAHGVNRAGEQIVLLAADQPVLKPEQLTGFRTVPVPRKLPRIPSRGAQPKSQNQQHQNHPNGYPSLHAFPPSFSCAAIIPYPAARRNLEKWTRIM